MLLKLKILPIVFMLLTSIVILPSSLSYAETGNVTATIPSIAPASNQTATNQTSVQPTISSDNNTNVGQQISSFVHNATAKFQQQKSETRKTMLECRDKIQAAAPSDIDKIRDDCKIQLTVIKQKYQQDRMKFHDLFKTYRESVLTFMKEAKGLQVEKAEMDKAFENVKNKMNESIGGGKMLGHGKGLMATKNNTNCVNPAGKPTGYC